jgi:hypothetical protein
MLVVRLVLRVMDCVASVSKVVGCIPVSPCNIVVGGVLGDDVVNVFIDAGSFGRIIAGHVDT